jgi:hypothetical protein
VRQARCTFSRAFTIAAAVSCAIDRIRFSSNRLNRCLRPL